MVLTSLPPDHYSTLARSTYWGHIMKFYQLAAALICNIYAFVTVAADVSNEHKAIALLNSIETGDTRAIEYVNPDKYIQHNLAVADGLKGFGEVMKMLPPGSAQVNVVRHFQDGDYVVTHTDYNFFGPKIGFDVFRFEDGKIVEHWDNLTDKVKTPNPSGRTQLDGETRVSDFDKTLENKALVASFVTDVLIAGQFNKLSDYISTTEYLQHNTGIADGLNGLSEGLASMASEGIQMRYTDHHKVLGQGNFVLAISEGWLGGEHVSFYDLFRIARGKIVEHWDVIEPIAEEADRKNTNGKFNFIHTDVVEVATFSLKEGVSAEVFRPIDKQVETTYITKQPGFISRKSGMTTDNLWRVVVHWESFEDADASMASFMAAPATEAFMKHLDPSTMVMRRFVN